LTDLEEKENRDSFFPPRFDNICTSVQPLQHMSRRQQLNCIYCIILGFFLYAGIFARAFGTGQFIDDLKWWLLPRQEDKMKLEMEVKKADAIVLTYSCDRAQTLDRLSTYWLPELRRLEVSCLSSLSCSMPWPPVYLRGRQSKLLVKFFLLLCFANALCSPCRSKCQSLLLDAS
jgi:hypothetical protein